MDQKKRKKTYIIHIGRSRLEVCSACYQRLRRLGRIKMRPYGSKDDTDTTTKGTEDQP